MLAQGHNTVMPVRLEPAGMKKVNKQKLYYSVYLLCLRLVSSLQDKPPHEYQCTGMLEQAAMFRQPTYRRVNHSL